uniref:Uncharacterized protein n=1 Tax=Anguilla anguilla TaxID=7936 RepID=A0A0E9UTU6_ANGAN
MPDAALETCRWPTGCKDQLWV